MLPLFQISFRVVPLVCAVALISACDEHPGGVNPQTQALVVAADQAPPRPVQPSLAPVLVNCTLPEGVVDNGVAAVPAPLEPTVAGLSSVRIFEEPLVVVGPVPTVAETQALATALEAFRRRTIADDGSALEAFISRYPTSSWRPSLEFNLGFFWRRSGHFSKAIAAWTNAWELGHEARASAALAQMDRALAERILLTCWVGRMDDAGALLALAATRPLPGAASERVSQARQALAHMRSRPGDSFKCGPFAVARLLALERGTAVAPPPIRDYATTPQGTSLVQVRDLAARVGLPLQIAKRQPGAELITPAILHWSLGHFSALIVRSGAHYQIADSTMDTFYGQSLSVSAAALDQEGSGYYLVRAGALPAGWTPVADAEADTVWGRGYVTGMDPTAYGCGEPSAGGCTTGCNKAMPGYTFQLAMVNLRITDTPVGYTPPKGPEMNFTVVYNQRESQQPSVFTYGNLGQRWTHSWFAYVQDSTPSLEYGTSSSVLVYLPTGGTESYLYQMPGPPPPVWIPAPGAWWTHPDMVSQSWVNTNPDGANFIPPPVTQSSGMHSAVAFSVKRQSRLDRLYNENQPVFTKSGTWVNGSYLITGYRRVMPDGTTYEFKHSDGGTPRKLFLTKQIDPWGNAVTLGYDGQHRLVSLTDALGQVTVVSYEHADPLKITKVTDPFGRFATFAYDVQGRLSGITDVIGMTSTFGFVDAEDGIDSMTTPYGTTAFTYGDYADPIWGTPCRFVEATDPMGNKERVELRNLWNQLVPSAEPRPAGMPVLAADPYLEDPNSLYFDKKAMREGPGDWSKAVIYHWLRSAENVHTSSSVLSSVKHPLDRRIWFSYPGQTDHTLAGVTIAKPAIIGRVLPDGSSQLVRMAYNSLGRTTQIIDPLGRRTDFTYDASGMDLLHVDQFIDALTSQRLATLTYGGVANLPTSIRDAAGQVTTMGYNGAGQPTSVTDALNRVTTLVYTPVGYLDKVIDPSLAETLFGYDGYGRVRTVTDRDGDVVTTDYDALDRAVQVTYPDASTEQIAWNKLDVEWVRDRAGRWTRIFTNAIRQTVATRDPMGRTTLLEWCLCGSLSRLTDPAGAVTRWTLDLQGRPLAKIMPDLTRIESVYDSVGRLTSVTDAKGQVANFTYAVDDRLLSVAYTNALVLTPAVNYVYDPIFPRLVSMSDGIGTTAYTYYPITAGPYTLGAGQVQNVDGPWANDTVTYTYDQLGRALTQSINGTASSVVYDTLGRLDALSNSLGSFDYVYDANTARLASVLYPNNQQTTFSYFGQSGLRRLQTIANKKTVSGPNISTFGYTYDSVGRIATWSRQNDAAAASTYTFGYDRGDQLVSAVLKQGATVQAQYGYGYEPGGNRTQRQGGAGVVTEITNKLNQLTGESFTGDIRIEGSTNEAATVTVNGQPVEKGTGEDFSAKATVAPGANTITIAATDPANNTVTKHFSFTNANGSGRSFSYDLNGNTVSDGIRAYTWDGKDQLASIEWTPVVGTTRRTEFTYNGLGQRVRMVEKTNGSITSNITYLWANGAIAEERDSTGATVAKRYLAGGMMVGATKYFFTGDHLGSIREVTDNSGNVVSRFDYDPYGNRTQVSGTFDPGMGFTGHFHHSSGLILTWFRAYDPQTARWLSRDPLKERGGVNLYAYVRGNPLSFIDRDGRIPVFLVPFIPGIIGGAGGFVGGVIVGLLTGNLSVGNVVAATISGAGAAYGILPGIGASLFGTWLGGQIEGCPATIPQYLGNMAGAAIGARFGGGAFGSGLFGGGIGDPFGAIVGNLLDPSKWGPLGGVGSSNAQNPDGVSPPMPVNGVPGPAPVWDPSSGTWTSTITIVAPLGR